MTTKEIQTSVEEFQQPEEKADIMSQIKGFISQKFSKGNDGTNNGDTKGQAKKDKSRAFVLTKKTLIIYVTLAVLAVAGAVVTGYNSITKYKELNENRNPLHEVGTYNVTPNKDILNQYVEGDGGINSIEDVVSVYTNTENVLQEREEFKAQQQTYYQALLQNIYLPSLNVWKNPYTKSFDMTILGQKYLEKDKFQDLYLIQYWSDFFKYVGNDADYNVIKNITLGSMEEVEGTDYFYIPVSITFASPNKRSFLLLVNKLSMTSNAINVSLLNEFIFYLFSNIKDMKSAELLDLEDKYRSEFQGGSDYFKYNSLSELSADEELYDDYKNKVIGYHIYKWLNNELTGNTLVDDKVIVAAIEESAMCGESMDQSICFYNFRDKYRDIPYLAYGIGLGSQNDRTQGLKDFLNDLPSVIAVTDFGFERFSNASFLNNKNDQEQYEGTIAFNAYGRGISEEELTEASTVLGNLCFGEGNGGLSPASAHQRVKDSLSALGSTDDANNVTALNELDEIFEEIELTYEGLSNYNKMIKLFESRRMINDANLCNI